MPTPTSTALFAAAAIMLPISHTASIVFVCCALTFQIVILVASALIGTDDNGLG